MSRWIRVAAVALSMSAVPALAQDAPAAPPNTHLHFVAGQKMLDDKDWNKEFKAAGLPNLKTQTLFGLETSWGPEKLPISFATDILYSTASGKSTSLNRTVTATTLELGVGVRKIFPLPVKVNPYVGGGLAYGTGAVTCSGCSSRAPSGTGFWFGTGAFYSLGKLNAGAGVRYSAIDGKDGAVKLKVGGINANASVGMGF